MKRGRERFLTTLLPLGATQCGEKKKKGKEGERELMYL